MAYADPNITGITSWFQYTNSVTDSYFGLVLVAIIFTIAFTTLKGVSNTKEAFSSAMFLVMISTILLRIIGLVSNSIFLIVFAVTIISAAMLYISSTPQSV